MKTKTGIGISWVFALMLMLMPLAMTGCGTTVQPKVEDGEVNDQTLNGATVDMFTFLRVQNNYGTTIRIDGSANAKVTK